MAHAISLNSAPKVAPKPPHRVLGNRNLVREIMRNLPPEKGYALVNKTFHQEQGRVMAERAPTVPLDQRLPAEVLVKRLPGVEPDQKGLCAFAKKSHDHIHERIQYYRYNLDIPEEKRIALSAAWDRVTQGYYTPHNAREKYDQPQLLRLCACYHLIDTELATHRAYHEYSRDHARNFPIDAITGHLQRFLAQESLDLRIKRVFGEQREPEKMAGLYQQLHQGQWDSASFDPAALKKFKEATQRLQKEPSGGSYSYERFLELETFTVQAQTSRVEKLREFARAVRRASNVVGIHLLTTEQEIVDFLNNPDLQEAFANIESLGVLHSALRDPVVMETLKKLRSLRNLTITRDPGYEPLREFPQELTALTQLRFLWIEGQAFSKIPDEATQFPELLVLDLYKNSEQIKELPEAFTRHYLGGWASLAFEPVRELVPLIGIFMHCTGANPDTVDDLRAYYNYHTASLNPEQFEKIPYHLWFREHFSIPYIPSLLITPVIMLLTGAIHSLNKLMTTNCGQHDPRPDTLTTLISLFLFTLVFIPSTLLMIVLDLPIFVLNVIINRVIEPIVSWVRESCCGCDPMVEL